MRHNWPTLRCAKWVCGLPIAMLGAPIFLYATSASSHLVRSVPPIDSPEVVSLNLAEDISSVEMRRQIAVAKSRASTIQSKLKKAQSELQDCELRLKLAKQDQIKLPAVISELRLQLELEASKKAEYDQELTGAKESYRVNLENVSVRMFSGKVKAEKIRADELNFEFARIDMDRQLRNEKRASLGARPEGQDEYLLVRQKKRRVSIDADLRYEASIAELRSNIDNELAEISGRIQLLSELILNCETVIQETQAELMASVSRFSQLPVVMETAELELSQFASEVERLIEFGTIQESEILVAEGILSGKVKKEQAVASRLFATVVPSPQNENKRVGLNSGNFSASYYMPRNAMRYFPSPGLNCCKTSNSYHSVSGYYRKDGTYVRPHNRTNSDHSLSNNWSSRGNRNPFTGMKGYRRY